jgi:hypothetical protein
MRSNQEPVLRREEPSNISALEVTGAIDKTHSLRI